MRFVVKLLTMPLKGYTTRFPNNITALKQRLRKGDVVLVEGNQRLSQVIKYLTQSSWSHSAIYVGDEIARRAHPSARALVDEHGEEARYALVEALVESGVVASPLCKYASFNLRVCRPRNLRREDLQAVLDEVVGEIGHEYDLKNVFDLARYFFPVSLVPTRFRRKALRFGSGLPTQVICSSLIALAFGKVGYPILPTITIEESKEVTTARSWFDRFLGRGRLPAPGVFRRPSATLVTPRDFDLSPYFEIVKFNALGNGEFDYRKIVWAEEEGRAH